MPKPINPLFRAAYKKVLVKAASDATFRDALLGGNKKAAVAAMDKVLKNPSMAQEIAETIYIDNSNFRPLKPQADYLIKFLSFVFGNLSPKGAAVPKSAARGITGAPFDDIEDWENCW